MTPPVRKPTQVLSFTPEQLVEGIAAGDLGRAVDRLIEFLEMLQGGGDVPAADDAVRTAAYAWWAERIAQVLGDEGLRLSDAQYARLAARHREMTHLFSCAPGGNADRWLMRVAERIAARGLDVNDAQRLLLGASLYSSLDIGMEDFLAAAPSFAWRAFFGILSSQTVLTEGAAAHRRRLLALGPALEGAEVPFEELSSVAQIWYLCSYADGPDKHRIKAHLNRIFRASMAAIGVTDDVRADAPRDRRRARPTMLVPVEQFKSTHAMFRCYAPTIAMLAERFDLVLVADPAAVDAPAKALFRRTIPIDRTRAGFRRAVAEIRRLAPDIIYYPSVGMATEIIALANLRLAPIQVASPGHPATTHAGTIDYMVLEDAYADAAPHFSERVVLCENGGIPQAKRPDAVPVAPELRGGGGPVRISVASAVFKLNAEFLGTCRRIGEGTARDLEFHFFPNLRGLALHHATRRIRDVLPGAQVHPSTDYPTYIAALNACDLQLAPFPFGGTNSTMDALHQGIPSVALETGDVHGRSDATLLHHAGVPGWLVTGSEEAYVHAALRLIEGDEERLAIRRALLDTDLDALFHDTTFERTPRDVAALFGWLCEAHERIQADGRALWTREARHAFPAAVASSESESPSAIARANEAADQTAGMSSPALMHA